LLKKDYFLGTERSFCQFINNKKRLNIKLDKSDKDWQTLYRQQMMLYGYQKRLDWEHERLDSKQEWVDSEQEVTCSPSFS
jgi:hypothetical protein